jgi:hypothetical protein
MGAARGEEGAKGRWTGGGGGISSAMAAAGGERRRLNQLRRRDLHAVAPARSHTDCQADCPATLALMRAPSRGAPVRAFKAMPAFAPARSQMSCARAGPTCPGRRGEVCIACKGLRTWRAIPRG